MLSEWMVYCFNYVNSFMYIVQHLFCLCANPHNNKPVETVNIDKIKQIQEEEEKFNKLNKQNNDNSNSKSSKSGGLIFNWRQSKKEGNNICTGDDSDEAPQMPSVLPNLLTMTANAHVGVIEELTGGDKLNSLKYYTKDFDLDDVVKKLQIDKDNSESDDSQCKYVIYLFI